MSDMENWVAAVVKAEKESLLFACCNTRKSIAEAMPIAGRVGGEFQEATEVLGRLIDKLLLDDDLADYRRR